MIRILLVASAMVLASASPPARAQSEAPGAFDRGYQLTFPETGNPDYAAGRDWLGRAATAGDPAAHYMLGLIHRDGLGTPENLPLARQHFEAGWQAGDSVSGYNLAELLLFRFDGETAVARALLEELLEDPDVGALAHLSLADALMFYGTDPSDAARAIGLARTALTRDDRLIEAHYILGIGAMEGLAGAADPAAALTHWQTGARAGDPYAMLALADVLLEGRVGAPDPVQAVALYTAAARLGHPDAAGLAAQHSAWLSATQRSAAESAAAAWLEH
ncbi:tetratricopeptide repeat protein [Maricaulis sp. CAU 1757]